MLYHLYSLLADIAKIDDILFIIKNNGATAEIRSNLLDIRQTSKWITLGDNDGPAHMHINPDQILYAKFIQEVKPERTSFSVRFFDDSDQRVLAAFFTKMYDESRNIIPWRKKTYLEIQQKYSDEKIIFRKNTPPPAD